jgi:hypothetical protein
MTKIEEVLQLKKKLFFLSKIAIYLSPRPPLRRPKLQEKPSALKRTSSAFKP